MESQPPEGQPLKPAYRNVLLHELYKQIFATSIRLLEQTIHGSVSRASKAKAEYLAAVAEGIKRPEAQSMVVNSAIGMMQLVPEAGAHPSVLREQIASPGGCSIRALLELERQGVRSSFTSAILAAAERSKQMSSSGEPWH